MNIAQRGDGVRFGRIVFDSLISDSSGIGIPLALED